MISPNIFLIGLALSVILAVFDLFEGNYIWFALDMFLIYWNMNILFGDPYD